MKPLCVYLKLVDQAEIEYNACLIFTNNLSIIQDNVKHFLIILG